MRNAALMALGLGVIVAAICPGLRAQAIAESAVIHANSGITAGISKVIGGHVEQSLSHTGRQFSYPPRGTRTARGTRAYHEKAGARRVGTSPIAIKSVVGGATPCAAAPKPVSPQAQPGAISAKGTCVPTNAPAAVTNAKSTPNEITVSF